jgi:DNA mismatch endonuclease (patch repair protein)
MGAFVGVTTPQRSRIMSAIKGKGNKATELRFIAILQKNRITGWRRGSTLVGRPDVVFPRQKLAVFLDGCFWHGCPRCYRPPSVNVTFWSQKVLKNRLRDKRTTRKLRLLGWKVLRLWECKLVDENRVKHKVDDIMSREDGRGS